MIRRDQNRSQGRRHKSKRSFNRESFVFFNDLHTDSVSIKLGGMARNKSSEKSLEKPKTVQRTYRFDTKVFEAFEEDCARHLSNPKRVIEAMILHWLSAGSDARAAMAKKHRDEIGTSRDD